MVTIVFFVAGITAILASVAVVSVPSIFTAALSLVVSFVAIAVLYITLDADFLAAAQFMVYVGGIAVLILFAVMMTGQVNRASRSNRLTIIVGITGILAFTALAFLINNTVWPISSFEGILPPMVGDASTDSNIYLADILFGKYLLTFELAGVLLLVATIAALVIARER